ncbi:hypothetical protein NGB36_01415 [Streptomyces sp. RB6PN25]|uniref:MFS transporter n=1 Tax=Streptomyces humicola TaxID=2953240 RepID=A0ABT1PQ97_9ACTN|nr:hypothetical protein [Streptomyces humicola]MCQ4079298.1 hypothetical protein [Streptomyces humicola]
MTIVNVALPRIGTGLAAGASGLQWVVDGYALALTSLMLASGALGDLHGRAHRPLNGEPDTQRTGHLQFGEGTVGVRVVKS